jgi:2-aminoadipate transaminase
MILEDNAYSELRYSGKKIPSIKSLDKHDLVIYTSTFSKILSPGFRLGWVIANEEVIKKLVIAKQGTDLCSNVFCQYIAEEYIHSGLMDKHIPKVIRMYKRKRDVMLKALKKYFPKEVEWTRPDGGLFLWVTLPKYFDTEDTQDMFSTAIKEKVAFVHGAAFFAERKGHKNTIRLNFSNTADRKIELGIKRLAKIIKERMK